MVPGMDLSGVGYGQLFNTSAYLTRLLRIPNYMWPLCVGTIETILSIYYICMYIFMYTIYATNIYVYIYVIYN